MPQLVEKDIEGNQYRLYEVEVESATGKKEKTARLIKKEVMEQLHLKQGDRVRVIIEKA